MKEPKNISNISHFYLWIFWYVVSYLLKTNKQAIDLNATSKVVNKKSWTGQSISKMKTSANIVKREYFSRIYMLDMWHSLFQLCVGKCNIFLAGCNHFLAGCGWVWAGITIFWLGVGEWMWPFLDSVWMGVGGCEII